MSNLLKKVTSAVAGLAIVFSVVSPIAGVSAAYTSLEAANKLATLGVIVDQSANPADYRLGDSISRREQVKLAMNLASCQAVTVSDSCTGVYSDLSSSDWGCKYAESAYTNGFIAGNAMFNPNRDVSKAEALKMIMNATGLVKGANTMWEAAYVEGGVSAGIVTSFSDYSVAASRGWIFQAASEAVDLCGATNEEDDLLGSLLDGLDDTGTGTTSTGSVTPPVISADSEAMLSLSPENPANGYVAVNTPRAMMMAFDVTAGDTDVTLSKATFFHVGLGNRTNIDDVTIYNSNNEKVSKSKSFSNNDLDVSFDKNIVVKAGETQTFMVGATIAGTGNENTTYQIRLTNLEANVPVVGGAVTGAALVPTVLANSALLKVSANTANDTATVGEEITLAGFTVDERNDNEDVIIKTITLHQNGSISAEYLDDLTLTADGEVVASNLTVNANDELVANIDFVLAAKDKVAFELTGMVSGDVGETVHFEFEGNDDIYAVGASSGFNVGFDGANTPANANIADAQTVEGAEIDAAFTRSDIDQTKVDVDDVLVGTLSLTANSNDYNVSKITVKVTSTTLNATQIAAALNDVYLDGASFDTSANTGANEVTYTFEDISLTEGVATALDVTFDLDDNVALNNNTLTFGVQVAEIEDDENNITYNLTNPSPKNVSDVMSSNSFNTKSIAIETASFTLTKTTVNARQLVLGNGVETVLYKGKISVGDSDDVTIKDFDFANTGTALSGGLTLKDVIDTATINIGGKTYKGKVNSTTIDFSSINNVVAAGSDNVEVLLTAVLKDNNGVVNLDTLAVTPSVANINLEDSDGETVLTTGVSAAQSTITTLLAKGTLAIKVLNEVDTDDNLQNTVLAGGSNVVLAELEMEAQYEDIKVKNLTFKIAGATNFSDTLNNVRIVSGSKTIASGAIVTFDGVNTIITFKNTVTIADADDLISAELVADLNPITGQGDAVTAVAGNVQLQSAVTTTALSDVKGVSSNDDITLDTTGTVAGEIVAVVPTKLNFSVVNSLSTGTAEIKITAESGNNTVGVSNQKPKVVITGFTPTQLANGTDYQIYKAGNAAGAQATFAALSLADRSFDTSANYVYVPQTTDGTKSYTMVLSGTVATYNVVDNNGVIIASGLTTTLSNDISVGSKSY